MTKILLQSITLDPQSSNFEYKFDNTLNGQLLLESDLLHRDLLPPALKIFLNASEKSSGSSMIIPMKVSNDAVDLCYFKQLITARNLSFLNVKVEAKNIFYYFNINIYQKV